MEAAHPAAAAFDQDDEDLDLIMALMADDLEGGAGFESAEEDADVHAEVIALLDAAGTATAPSRRWKELKVRCACKLNDNDR
jgi:hypothetical protein